MAIKSVQYVFNGTTYTLKYNQSTGSYDATVTAPQKSSYSQPEHKYGGKVIATDDAGNQTTVDEKDSTFGDDLKLRVLEKVAPVITITYPTAGALIINNKPVIKWKVTDDDSGVNPATIGITIDSGSEITGDSIKKTAITGGYSCEYTPASVLADGNHTVKLDAADYDGNSAVQKSVSFKVDTVAPTLTITAPTDGLTTNNSACTVSGKTNDATSSPVKVTVKLNSGSAQTVTVNADGTFSKALTLSSGENIITVVATDSAGKSTTVIREVTLDTGAPVFESIKLTPNPVDGGATFIISVKVTD